MKYLLLCLCLSSCANMPAFDSAVFSQGMSRAYLNQQQQEREAAAANAPQKIMLVDQWGRPIR